MKTLHALWRQSLPARAEGGSEKVMRFRSEAWTLPPKFARQRMAHWPNTLVTNCEKHISHRKLINSQTNNVTRVHLSKANINTHTPTHAPLNTHIQGMYIAQTLKHTYDRTRTNTQWNVCAHHTHWHFHTCTHANTHKHLPNYDTKIQNAQSIPPLWSLPSCMARTNTTMINFTALSRSNLAKCAPSFRPARLSALGIACGWSKWKNTAP